MLGQLYQTVAYQRWTNYTKLYLINAGPVIQNCSLSTLAQLYKTVAYQRWPNYTEL